MEHMNQALVPSHASSAASFIVGEWLKGAKLNSEKTHRAYESAINSFRDKLWQLGYDLDTAPRGVVLVTAQAWAALPRPNGTPVAANTYNQRLAILGSFYSYAVNVDLIEKHPIKGMKRMKVHEYQWARPIPSEVVEQALADIDTKTEIGRRDHALLMVALTTGRRLSELQGMSVGNIESAGRAHIVTFPHAKGGKVMRDDLTQKAWSSLNRHLTALYGKDWQGQSEAPVWVSFSDRSRGRRLSHQSIAEICAQRMGVSKVHALRHTFAHEMELAGAPISVIQARLGHSSLETTGRYLRALDSANNPYADKLADLFDKTEGNDQ